MAQTHYTCKQSAFTAPSHRSAMHCCEIAHAVTPSCTWWRGGRWSCRAGNSWTICTSHKRTSTDLHWLGRCVHACTLTNRKWCQPPSPGRRRRLLSYCDRGFLFRSFSSAPLSHGLAQIDTGPSVAGAHPSHPLISGLPLRARLSLTFSSPLLLAVPISHLSASISTQAISAWLRS